MVLSYSELKQLEETYTNPLRKHKTSVQPLSAPTDKGPWRMFLKQKITKQEGNRVLKM